MKSLKSETNWHFIFPVWLKNLIHNSAMTMTRSVCLSRKGISVYYNHFPSYWWNKIIMDSNILLVGLFLVDRIFLECIFGINFKEYKYDTNNYLLHHTSLYQKIIVIMWTCHHKRHVQNVPHRSNSFISPYRWLHY